MIAIQHRGNMTALEEVKKAMAKTLERIDRIESKVGVLLSRQMRFELALRQIAGLKLSDKLFEAIMIASKALEE